MKDQRTYNREYYRTNREAITERQRRWRDENRERYRANQLNWKIQNPEKIRASARKIQRRRQGVKNATAEQKTGACEICQRRCDLNLDHDHSTGDFRGWLCPTCNRALGQFKDNVFHLLTAARYLAAARKEQCQMSALDALISNFKANANVMPQVNPPAAAKVLETQTKPETEGKPEPAAAAALPSTSAPSATMSPTASPATSVTNQTEPTESKTRRTAAVVQAELDLVAAELAQVRAQLVKALADEGLAKSALAAEQGAHSATRTELEKAVEFAKSVVADNAKLAEQPAPDGSGAALTLAGCAEYLKAQGYGIFTLGGS